MSFNSTDLAAVLPASYTFVASDNGVHTFSATLNTAGIHLLGAADTIAAAVNGVQANISVLAPPATHLRVIGYPSPTTVGGSNSVTVTALDASNNVVPGYTGTVHFTSTDGAAVLPADYSFVAGDGGTHNFNVSFNTVGTQTLTATDTGTASINGSQANILVNAGAATHFTLTGYPSPASPGVSNIRTIPLPATPGRFISPAPMARLSYLPTTLSSQPMREFEPSTPRSRLQGRRPLL